MARTNLPLFNLVAAGFLYLPPAAPGLATAASGGTVANGVYLVIVTYVNALGETIGSAAASITTTGTGISTITVTSPVAQLTPYGAATGYNVYMTQAGGSTFTLQNSTPQAIGTNFLLSAPPSSTGVNPPLSDPAGSAIDQANGMNVKLASSQIPSVDGAALLLLRVKNTAAQSQNIILRAGGPVLAGNPPAFRQALGDLTIAVPTTGTLWLGPFDYARHAQTDNSINVDFNAGTTGTITAFFLPKNTGNY